MGKSKNKGIQKSQGYKPFIGINDIPLGGYFTITGDFVRGINPEVSSNNNSYIKRFGREKRGLNCQERYVFSKNLETERDVIRFFSEYGKSWEPISSEHIDFVIQGILDPDLRTYFLSKAAEYNKKFLKK